MTLKDFISFRGQVIDFEKTPYGFSCLFNVCTKQEKELLGKFQDSEIREAFHQQSQDTADLKSIEIGDSIVIKIDLSKFPNYFESFDDFIAYNRYLLKHQDFYVFDLDYHHSISDEIDKISSFLELQELITFLRELSTYENESNGFLELIFNKPDKICSIRVEYSVTDIENFETNSSIAELKEHVFEKSDQEARRKLFINEMINLISIEKISFSNLLKNWNTIVKSYRSSFQIYLSEFSFEKIKTSSQEYFHELTDRIYSTINKFSTYILAIPVAYLLILRFFDFEGKNFAKDTFLLVVGILYFVVIWFVLLNNLSKAFTAIENDISKFLGRIKNEEHLNEITVSLNTQKSKLIPSQKRKIGLVRIISFIILSITIGAYIFIHYEHILNYLSKSLSANNV
ncbi:hypothetical protein [Mesonia sp. K7]|uniref:hypothetical protein n=1 Tax=Mesonia sp. K7 TaxID=2218606 RepID=UPI000DA754E2|nr:hypothetical protein [Mesonia sp. K7]PZD76409.1 hypothetical protein DNG35_12080 [Mesonia sp. K7]